MTLDDAPAGAAARIQATDTTPEQARRLAELGLRPGEVVTPVHRASGGARVLLVGDARIAVARALLRSIAVVPA